MRDGVCTSWTVWHRKTVEVVHDMSEQFNVMNEIGGIKND